MFEPVTLLFVGGIVAVIAIAGAMRPLATDSDPFYV
jgi:hypothetical protein